jgi:hypothetical protein
MEDYIVKIAAQQMRKVEDDISLNRQEIDSLVQREKDLQREYDAWKTIVESRCGKPHGPDIQTPRPVVQVKIHDYGDNKNKTDFVRAAFKDAGIKGLSSAELVAKVKDAEIDASRSFPYTAINKMKARGELIESSGRYRLSEYVEDRTQENLKMEEASGEASNLLTHLYDVRQT